MTITPVVIMMTTAAITPPIAADLELSVAVGERGGKEEGRREGGRREEGREELQLDYTETKQVTYQ